MSLFRYGFRLCSDGDSAFSGFGKKEEFKEILAILRRQNPDRMGFCEICRVQSPRILENHCSRIVDNMKIAYFFFKF